MKNKPIKHVLFDWFVFTSNLFILFDWLVDIKKYESYCLIGWCISGDRLLMVGDVDMTRVTHQVALDTLRRAPEHCRIVVSRAMPQKPKRSSHTHHHRHTGEAYNCVTCNLGSTVYTLVSVRIVLQALVTV